MIFESLGQLPDNLFMMIGSSIVMAHQLSVGAREDKQKQANLSYRVAKALYCSSLAKKSSIKCLD